MCVIGVPVTPEPVPYPSARYARYAYRARLSRALAPAAPTVTSPLLSPPVPSPLLSRRPCCPVPSHRPCCPVPLPLPSRRPCRRVTPVVPSRPVAPVVPSRRPLLSLLSRRVASSVPSRPVRIALPVPSASRFPSRPVACAPYALPVRRAPCALPVRRAPCALPVLRARPVRRAPAAPCPSVAPRAPYPSIAPHAPYPSVAPHAPCPSVAPPLCPARPSSPMRHACPSRSPCTPVVPVPASRVLNSIHLYASAMATPRVMRFDAEGRPLEFSVWLLRARRLLESQVQAHETLWAHASGDLPEPAGPAPLAAIPTPANSGRYARERADVTAWKLRDTAACIALNSLLPESEETHFTQVRTASEFLTAIKARYATPTTVSRGRMFLPFLFLDLASFERIADLITHLRSLDSSYRVACTDAQLALLPYPMAITIYFIATSLPDRLASVLGPRGRRGQPPLGSLCLWCCAPSTVPRVHCPSAAHLYCLPRNCRY
ncbi:unnamed protein product [Closterium sp. NIES-54]